MSLCHSFLFFSLLLLHWTHDVALLHICYLTRDLYLHNPCIPEIDMFYLSMYVKLRTKVFARNPCCYCPFERLSITIWSRLGLVLICFTRACSCYYSLMNSWSGNSVSKLTISSHVFACITWFRRKVYNDTKTENWSMKVAILETWSKYSSSTIG